MSGDVGAEVAAVLTEAEREAVLRAHVHISPAALIEAVERIIAVRVEAAKAESVASMAALFRDIRADHITPHEAATLCDLRADSYRPEADK